MWKVCACVERIVQSEHVNPISPLRQRTANPANTAPEVGGGRRGGGGGSLFIETRVSLLFLGSDHVHTTQCW